MSAREDFLARWSRRKRQLADEVEDAPASAQRAQDDQVRQQEKPPLEGIDPPFDPATLPSLESITAETDIRAFLAPGVPAEITRAALRRAWAADPAIRDFVGLADYAWDFNAPGRMAGFGPLEMTEELRREIVGMLTRDWPAEKPTVTSASVPPETTAKSPEQCVLDQARTSENGSASNAGVNTRSEGSNGRLAADDGNVAPQYMPEKPQHPQSVQRRHGRALPKS